MLRDHRGLTLVELLVAVAIASIVAVAVGAFMIVGARTFTSTSSEVNLQHESQIAYNQLQDLIIDTTLGVDYVYIEEGDSTEHSIYSDADIPGTAVVGEKRIKIYNDTIAYIIIWDADVNELFYEEYNVTYSSTGGAVFGAANVTHALMAEFITDFGIDVNRLEDKNIVRVDMEFERVNKNYNASYNITVRNKVVVNGDPATFTPTVPTLDMMDPLDEIYVQPGRSYDLAVLLHPLVKSSTDLSYTSTDVLWKLDTGMAPTSSLTGIDIHSGLLRVSNAEEGGSFKVNVASKTGTASGTALVHVIRVKTITFGSDAFEKGSGAEDENNNGIFYDDLKAGETFTLKAIVDGPYVAEAYAKGDANIHFVNWEAMAKSMDYVEPIGTGTHATAVIGSKTVGVETCQFRIKDADDLITDAKNLPAICVQATSQRSIDATYPYQNNTGSNEPVIGKWEAGKYYKKPYDWIITGSNLYRGGQPVIGNSDNVGVIRNNYFFIYTLKVTERLYKEDGSKVERQLSKAEIENAGFYDNDWGSTNLKLVLSERHLNANAEYLFEVECYILPPKAHTDHAGKSALLGMKVPRLGNTDPTAGYNLADAKAVGGGYKELLHRVKIYYNNENQLKYYPREFGVGKDGWNNMVSSLRKEFNVVTKEGDITTNVYNNGASITFYENVGGKWVKYKSSDAGNTLFNHGMFQELQFNPANNLIFRYNFNKWYEDIPQNLRLIPTIKDSSGREYFMFDSYVDVYTWNILVDKFWLGLSGSDDWICTEKCYFPCPMDTNFPGVTTVGTRAIWRFPYTTKAENQSLFDTVRNKEIGYSIVTQKNADNSDRYILTLYQGGTDTIIDTYFCDENSRVWTEKRY